MFRAVAAAAVEQVGQFSRLQRKMLRAAVSDFVNANPAGVDHAVVRVHNLLEAEPTDVLGDHYKGGVTAAAAEVD